MATIELASPSTSRPSRRPSMRRSVCMTVPLSVTELMTRTSILVLFGEHEGSLELLALVLERLLQFIADNSCRHVALLLGPGDPFVAGGNLLRRLHELLAYAVRKVLRR